MMPKTLILPDQHIFYSAENDIQQGFSNSLLPYNIEYFEYVRVYNDGHCICLSNKAELLRYVFKEGIPVVAPVKPEFIKDKFHYLLLPISDSYVKALHEVKDFFNLSHFINFAERHSDYIEIGCFGGHGDDLSLVNFYLNHIEILENAFHAFRDQYAPLIRRADKHNVLLPESMRPPFSGFAARLDNCTQPTRMTEKPLTARQADCLFYLTKGLTIKNIASTLRLAPKTVEHYLEAVKTKLHCHNRAELIEKAFKLPFIKERLF